jgi:hypothetical protein
VLLGVAPRDSVAVGVAVFEVVGAGVKLADDPTVADGDAGMADADGDGLEPLVVVDCDVVVPDESGETYWLRSYSSGSVGNGGSNGMTSVFHALRADAQARPSSFDP